MAEKKASKFDQAAYIREYGKENYTRVSVVLSRKYDSDIIEHLDKVEASTSKNSYIKQLIRKDMKSDDQ